MSGDAPSMSEKIELFAASSYTIKRKSGSWFLFFWLQCPPPTVEAPCILFSRVIARTEFSSQALTS